MYHCSDTLIFFIPSVKRGGAPERPNERTSPGDPLGRALASGIHAQFTLGRYDDHTTPQQRSTESLEEGTVASGKRISIKLSPEQQRQVKQATGKDAGALELTVEELEERIAPAVNAYLYVDGITGES